MKRAHVALLGISAVLCPNPAPGAELPIDGVRIGASVTALAQALGPPLRVASSDSGNRFVFSGETSAWADDDGTVLAVDIRVGTAPIAIDGRVRAFGLGSYSLARADVELTDFAEFATPTVRSYRLEPRRDLVLTFGAASSRLERLTYGEPGQLVRLGLLAGDAAAKAVPYVAPRPTQPPTTAPSGPSTVVFRIAVDRSGAVTGVDTVIPSASPARDEDRARGYRHARYLPARLGGRPIAAAVFVEDRYSP